jgi:3-deoxy-D-manno-octulosonic-acid transferase
VVGLVRRQRGGHSVSRQQFAGLAYSALLTLLTPAYLLRLWWRGRAEPLYRQALGERLGHYDTPASRGWVWLHAVSLGEARAAGPLIDALRRRHPALRLLLTHGTATGRAAGQALLRDGDVQAWLPFDTRGAVQRFLLHHQPAIGVLMETEVWPNLLAAAQAQDLVMVLANARLSERSLRKGRRFEALIRPAVASLAAVLAQTEADAQRLRAIGAREVRVMGNLKYDLTPDAAQRAQGRAWRDAQAPRRVVLAASSREGEEGALLACWAMQPQPRPLLLIVPRHPQRFDAVEALVRAAGLTCLRRSGWAEAPPPEAQQADVWLGDSMGEMALYFAAAQVALLGGSFAPLGGQNLIEAAACGCPVVMGPHTFNFKQAAELALAAGAALRVADIEAGVAAALRLLNDAPRCDAAVAHSLAFAASHRGAAECMAGRIEALMAGAGVGRT